MKKIKWRDPKLMAWFNHDDLILTFGKDIHRDFKFDHLRDSLIFYYKMAIDNDPTEFHYLKELILFLSNMPENKDSEIQQIITLKLENYTDKEKKWLKKYLDSFNKNQKNKS
jgi:hypothetical protein